MSLYLDTNVVIPLFVPEPRTRAVLHWVERQDGALYVADLVATEFNAAISRLMRERKLDASLANAIRAQFDSWRDAAAEPLENVPADIRNAGQMVCIASPKLLAADAVHLATCKRCGLTLVTDDEALREIAMREGVGVVWVPAPD